ncbi:MAG: hypothetical protein QF752_06165 [Planctomycetota bacterium]|jgi:hypothetical protein|nr:hypothetical protein [Planctomycetota bacterium]
MVKDDERNKKAIYWLRSMWRGMTVDTSAPTSNSSVYGFRSSWTHDQRGDLSASLDTGQVTSVLNPSTRQRRRD